MVTAIDRTITKLVVAAMDAARVSDRAWQSRFRISAARLRRIRDGQTSLTDAELNRISRATGEPWQSLVVGLLGSNDKPTSDTRELLSNLHALNRSAAAEANKKAPGKPPFENLKSLLRRNSA